MNLIQSVFIKVNKAILLYQHEKSLQQLRLSHPSPPLPHLATVNHIYNNNGLKLLLDHFINGNPERGHKALHNELGQLTQSNFTGVSCTDAIEFIHDSEIPHYSKITYVNFVCDHKPLKSE